MFQTTNQILCDEHGVVPVNKYVFLWSLVRKREQHQHVYIIVAISEE